MAFKPKQTGGGGGGNFDFVAVYPKNGNRLGRVSLIVDMGIQAREDFVDPKTSVSKPQKACQQVAVFADLVNDVVDYGGKIGKAQYRMLLNKTFKGQIEGVNFTTVAPKDGDGNIIKGKPWTFHPANLLTKLAHATGNSDIIYDDKKPRSLDIDLLLDEPLLINVEVKETEAKDKKDKDGNPVIYRNVNFKGATPVPPATDANGDEVEAVVKPLTRGAMSITFDNAEKDDIQFIRKGLLDQIKLALNYAGSKMQAAVEAWEAEQGQSGGDDEGDEGGEDEAPAPAPAPTPAPKPAAKTAKPAAKTTKKPAAKPADEDEDVPF